MTRTERLFALADALRARRTGVTAEELAERFGVSARTIYRDLDSLRDAELPVRAERGRGGGYALDRAYTLPPINLSAREAAVLVAAGEWLGRMRAIPFTTTLAGALDKVRGALSESAQRELLRRLDTLQFVGVPAHDCDEGVRRAVEQAFFEQRGLRILYDGRAGCGWRRVRLESVVMDRYETRLNAFDEDKGAPRQFTLRRIREAEVLPL